MLSYFLVNRGLRATSCKPLCTTCCHILMCSAVCISSGQSHHFPYTYPSEHISKEFSDSLIYFVWFSLSWHGLMVEGYKFWGRELVSNTSPSPWEMSICVLVTHIRGSAGNQDYPRYHTALWNLGRRIGCVTYAEFWPNLFYDCEDD